MIGNAGKSPRRSFTENGNKDDTEQEIVKCHDRLRPEVTRHIV